MAKDKKNVESTLDKVELKTHLLIDRMFGGNLEEIRVGYAKVVLATTKEMVVDELNLVHGGFTFGAADFAAMAAVNEPNVVLAEAVAKFLAPVEVGKTVVFEANTSHNSTRTRDVKVIGMLGEIKVFEGDFKAVILDRHPLRLKLAD
ncbi:MAG: hotdog domain-containing protein [Campylobacterales bacterium]|nr:hotdog domain-containing protein [Campylobacterales bacterium]